MHHHLLSGKALPCLLSGASLVARRSLVPAVVDGLVVMRCDRCRHHERQVDLAHAPRALSRRALVDGGRGIQEWRRPSILCLWRHAAGALVSQRGDGGRALHPRAQPSRQHCSREQQCKRRQERLHSPHHPSPGPHLCGLRVPRHLPRRQAAAPVDDAATLHGSFALCDHVGARLECVRAPH